MVAPAKSNHCNAERVGIERPWKFAEGKITIVKWLGPSSHCNGKVVTSDVHCSSRPFVKAALHGGLRDVKGQSEHGPEAGTRPGVANSGNRLKNTPAKVGRLLSCL